MTDIASSSIPTLRLNTGALMPIMGLGTWKSEPGVVRDTVLEAIKAGYRHFDCAMIYGNEAEIGTAFSRAFAEKLVERKDLFVTTKVFCHYHGERALDSCKKSLEDLQLDYVDLLLIHWPIKIYNETLPEIMADSTGRPVPSLRMEFGYNETWKYFEQLQKSGLAKAIGVSNFTMAQLADLMHNSSVVPACNQIEIHALNSQRKLVKYCKSKGIVVVGFSPLGTKDSYTGILESTPKLMTMPVIIDIAKECNRTPAQVLLRWIVQQEIGAIPKSVNPQRLRENLDIFGFQLNDSQMDQIHALNRDYRFGTGFFDGHFLGINE